MLVWVAAYPITLESSFAMDAGRCSLVMVSAIIVTRYASTLPAAKADHTVGA